MPIKKRVLVSVSGGRTSALMAYFLWKRYRDIYELIFVFANTSREKEETLLFVKQLEDNFGFPIVWIEAVVSKYRRASSHRVVTYETACRDGSVFEAVIAKYGIPNVEFKHCTRELKTNPIRSYARSIGWGHHKYYTTVIGYRKDEPKRVNLVKAEKNKQWYPLFEWNIKKSDVASFWLMQSFDLQLPDYDGNCKLCYKKSKRKLLTQIVKAPGDTVWVKAIEVKYENVHTRKSKDKKAYRFFRDNESIDDLIEQSKQPFELATDQSLNIDGADYDFELDEQENCAESCEPFAD